MNYANVLMHVSGAVGLMVAERDGEGFNRLVKVLDHIVTTGQKELQAKLDQDARDPRADPASFTAAVTWN